MMNDFSLVPEKLKCESESVETHVLVKDYITGMTDQFALDLYEKLTK
jgi:dGTP triphosphohydrolase